MFVVLIVVVDVDGAGFVIVVANAGLCFGDAAAAASSSSCFKSPKSMYF